MMVIQIRKWNSISSSTKLYGSFKLGKKQN